MGIVGKVAKWFIGGGGGGVVESVKDLVDEFVTTEEERLEYQLKKQELDLKREELDIKRSEIEARILEKIHETNIAEAKSKSWFIAGARPFILWVCGFAVLYHFVISPFLYSIFSAFNINFDLPELDIGILFNLMISMLGLAGLRTYEKVKGVNHRH